MSEVEDNFEDLTVAWTENGKEVVRELDRLVVQKSSGWATIAFLFEELDPDTGSYGSPRAQVRRYRKRGGRWQVNGKLVIGNEEAARNLARAIQKWFRPVRQRRPGAPGPRSRSAAKDP
jgi:hypothetical protein